MNKIKEIERDLKVAYLNYEDDDLKEALKYLDRVVMTILKDDESVSRDPFWKALVCYVFKALALNSFREEMDLTLEELEALLKNEAWVNKNLKDFCYHFRTNKEIDFVKHLGKISDKALEDVIEILEDNIEKIIEDYEKLHKKDAERERVYTQEDLREFFNRRMNEKEQLILNQLNLKEKISKLTNFKYQIKYLEKVGYVFIEEGFFALKTGGAPMRFSASILKTKEEAIRKIEEEFSKKIRY